MGSDSSEKDFSSSAVSLKISSFHPTPSDTQVLLLQGVVEVTGAYGSEKGAVNTNVSSMLNRRRLKPHQIQLAAIAGSIDAYVSFESTFEDHEHVLIESELDRYLSVSEVVFTRLVLWVSLWRLCFGSHWSSVLLSASSKRSHCCVYFFSMLLSNTDSVHYSPAPLIALSC